jgi:hypothetical protein
MRKRGYNNDGLVRPLGGGGAGSMRSNKIFSNFLGLLAVAPGNFAAENI